MAAEPVLKLATEYVRVAVANFEVRFGPAVEQTLCGFGLTLTDLNNALLCCQATWTSKTEAADALFEVDGETTEGIDLHIRVRVSADDRHVLIEEVS